MTSKKSRLLALTSVALVGLLTAGCSSPAPKSTSVPKSTPTTVAPAADMTPVNSQRSKDASAFVRAISLGGDATASKYISPTTRFGWNRVMKELDGCRLTTSWYGSGLTLSADVTCSDGDVVAVDITFDSSNKVTKLTGQGISRSFDSSPVGN